MYVQKRNGTREEVNFDAVLERIRGLAYGLDTRFVDVSEIAKRTIDGLHDNIKTTDLDALAAQVCASLATMHSDFSILAARIAISNLHKETESSFTDNIKRLHAYIEPKTGRHAPFVSDELLQIVHCHGERIDAEIVHDRDFELFDYFAVETLKKGYLMSMNDSIVERPQHMFMRVALGIHGDDLETAFETYHLLSTKQFTHATPTLFNAGTPLPQMSSCFLLAMSDDSISGIYKTLTDCARISQSAGGIGLSVHNIRAKGSYIAGSRGVSDGLIPMIKNFNETARYVNQGGKRKGAFCIYLEPWHADTLEFLDLRKNHGAEELRARDLFYALWIPDLFMNRVKEDGNWSFFCPKECSDLYTSFGKKFEELYTTYEQEGRMRKTIKARDLWFKIINCQIETGTPFMLYKDAANRKSNQKNVGVIRSSNLCTEIMEYSDERETAVCNLASICVNQFVKKDGTYDFQGLHDITKVVTRNLNKVIDRNAYILPECQRSNLRHRPIGIGVQGLADTFATMKLSFDEPAARTLNKHIFETIYHGAVEASVALAKRDGPYDSFKGSPTSQGKLQFDLWGVYPESGLFDWEHLREEVKKHGLRNSLLISPMPTATTAQIFGNNEAFEPFTSNLYVRRVLSGEFIVINKHLLRELIALGIWNKELHNRLIEERGSVQRITEIPEEVRLRYRTVWEIPQRSIIDMAADRGAFICQSQSLNIHMADATADKLTALHFYTWQRGLKTGMYYLRNTPAYDTAQFTVDRSQKQVTTENVKQKTVPTPIEKARVVDGDDANVCTSCGS